MAKYLLWGGLELLLFVLAFAQAVVLLLWEMLLLVLKVILQFPLAFRGVRARNLCRKI